MVRYSYEVPYPGNSATVKVSTIYPAARVLVVASPSLQVSGDGLQSGGQEQGMSVYGRENVPASNVMTVSVSGTAPALQNEASDSLGAAATLRMRRLPRRRRPTYNRYPGRLDVLKWPLIAGFVGIFALGAILLARKTSCGRRRRCACGACSRESRCSFQAARAG